MSNSSEAVDSFLGYLYQLRFGLLAALREKSANAHIAFELLDDIVLADRAQLDASVALHQLKHSIRNKASIGAKSKALWNRLGAWSDLIQTGKVDLDRCQFFLHTTGQVSNASPLRLLREDSRRAPEKARREIIKAAGTSSSTIVLESYSKLKILGVEKQKKLFERIYCADAQTNIIGLYDDLKSELRVACHPAHLDSHVRQLEGWFFDTAIRSLIPDGPVRVLPVDTIRAVSAQIRDNFVASSLPDEFSDSEVPFGSVLESDTRDFVKQLLLIRASRERIHAAQEDHYRAFAQRSLWAREGLVAIGELPKFDRKLINEWRRRHSDVRMKCQLATEESEIIEGMALFRWVEFDAPNSLGLQLRTAVSSPYLIRGSFHVLADRRDVGWHPRFGELLQQT
jgi:hypothetical protein